MDSAIRNLATYSFPVTLVLVAWKWKCAQFYRYGPIGFCRTPAKTRRGRWIWWALLPAEAKVLLRSARGPAGAVPAPWCPRHATWRTPAYRDPHLWHVSRSAHDGGRAAKDDGETSLSHPVLVAKICNWKRNSFVGDRLSWDWDCLTSSQTTILWVKSIIIMIDRDANSLLKRLDCFRLG